MSRTSQFVRIFTCAFAFLLLCGLMLSTSSKACAVQITKSIDSTMTITMQQSSDGDSTDEDTSSNNSTTDSISDKEKSSNESIVSSTVASKKDGNLPVTGDVLLFAIIGMVVLCVGCVYCLSVSKKLKYAHGAHVRRSFQSDHIRTQDSNKIKKRVVVVAVICALLATTCFGTFASKASAASEGANADVKCTSAVKIDKDGNVLQANVTVQNNSLKAIDVESVVAPTELEGWNATFETTSVAVSGSTTGTWDGKTVPAEILQQVKESGSVTLAFQLTVSTEPAPLDFSQFSLEEGDWVYDSTQKTPEVVCKGALVKDTDYTVTYGENINAGEGTVTIAGKGEYTGSKVFTFTISKAKLTASGIIVNSKTYDATTDATFNYDDMSVAGKVGADDVSVTATGTFPSANVGEQTVALTLTLAGIDVSNYELAGTGQQTSTTANITAKEVTITWDPTGEAEYAYNGAPHAPTAAVGNVVSGESISATLAYKDSSGADLTSAPSAIGTYTATVAALSGATASNYALPTAGSSKTFKITNYYWLAEADAESPEADMIKKQGEIEEDMEVLHGTKTQTSAGKDKTAINAEYTNYMNGKDAQGNTKEIRLYTKWNGEDAGTGANQWVEFRIIQVGEHLNYSSDVNSGDGSAVTFMATHSLPTAKQMNPTFTNAGGWTGSAMYKTVFASGGYVHAGLSDLAPAVRPVAKASTAGSEDDSWTTTTTQDKFWLMSYSELAGEDKFDHIKNEGSQYAWCKTNVTNPSGSNTAIADMSLTRDGSSPSKPAGAGGGRSWWERSTHVQSSFSFLCVGTQGIPSYGTYATFQYGVAPCFAF